MNTNGYRQRASGLWVPPEKDDVKVGGFFAGKILRDGRVIDEFEEHNIVVNAGLDDLLSAYLCGGSQTTNWYLAPFKGNYVPVASDTMQSLPGNAQESTEYTSTTRVDYNPVEANQSVTNSASPAIFTFNASVTIYGAFLTSSQGKNNTSGILFAATQFTTNKNVGNGDQLLLTYQVNASSS